MLLICWIAYRKDQEKEEIQRLTVQECGLRYTILFRIHRPSDFWLTNIPRKQERTNKWFFHHFVTFWYKACLDIDSVPTAFWPHPRLCVPQSSKFTPQFYGIGMKETKILIEFLFLVHQQLYISLLLPLSRVWLHHPYSNITRSVQFYANTS